MVDQVAGGEDARDVGRGGAGLDQDVAVVVEVDLTGDVKVVKTATDTYTARAELDPKISFAWNSTVVSLNGTPSLSSITLADTITGEQRELAVQGCFIAIGHDPRSALVQGEVDTDAAGYVLVQPGTTQTNLPGVFAAGDLVDHTYRQAITAAGTGCSAALDAERYLADLADIAELSQLGANV